MFLLTSPDSSFIQFLSQVSNFTGRFSKKYSKFLQNRWFLDRYIYKKAVSTFRIDFQLFSILTFNHRQNVVKTHLCALVQPYRVLHCRTWFGAMSKKPSFLRDRFRKDSENFLWLTVFKTQTRAFY